MTVQGNLGRGSRCGGRASFQVAAHMDMTNLQRGIAIGPILFVVALLAILAVAISAGTGVFNGDTSAVKIKAQATAILGYVDELQIGVDKVMARCPDTEISLANSVDSGYFENPLAPSDKSCHVFDVNGGGVLFKEPPPDVDLTGVPPELRHYFIHTYNEVRGLGNTVVGSNIGRELLIVLPGVTRDLCLKLNELVGVTMESGDAPTAPNIIAGRLCAGYWAGGNGYHTYCGSQNPGKSTCCAKIVAAGGGQSYFAPIGSYVFFHALHVR